LFTCSFFAGSCVLFVQKEKKKYENIYFQSTSENEEKIWKGLAQALTRGQKVQSRREREI